MGIRVFIFLFGFGITTIGLLYVISYLNLLTIGYNFSEYVNFIIRRPECLNTLWGFLCIVLSLYWKRGDKSELYI